ncbi:DNA internalization-related competence protein ComEC/Rec2 [Cohnella panacarvi]|uniref:DNA internalization-related competence protein ComEC/Rec2 n=1 Tax=Cohnella panacarvi TaxID=400776 RepID=UPI00146F9D1F|nr:DNA internalization-related competence protein ComEC/Rec2 [Cohnella panacarvi]
MNRRPLVAIACCFVTGTAIPSAWPSAGGIYALIGISLLLVALGAMGVAQWSIATLCLAGLLVATVERQWVDDRNATSVSIPNHATEADASIAGLIVSPVEVDGDLAAFKLRAATIAFSTGAKPSRLSESIMVRVKLAKQEEQGTASGWQRGDKIQLTGVLAQPGDAGNFGAFDYREYLRKQGVFWTLTAKGAESVQVITGRIPLLYRPLRGLDQFREHIGAMMDRLYPHGDAGYMKGLVAGITADIDPRQYDDFAKLGLTHILAISGLHVGVIVFILLRLGDWLRLTRERTIDVTIVMMPVYMLATGASPSAIRACLMAMLALWLARRHRLKDGLHLLAATAVVMLLWNPLLIEDVSFQLSFIVTAGLLLFVPVVTASLPLPWPWLRASIAVALTAQAVSFPVTVYYFHAVHSLSLLANFVLVPFVSFVILPLGMVSVALGAIGEPLGKPPAMLATLGNELTFKVVDVLATLVRLRTAWPQPSFEWVLAGFACMCGVAALLHRRQRRIQEDRWLESRDESARMQAERQSATIRPEVGHPVFHRSPMTVRALSIGLTALIVLWIVWGLRPSWTSDEGKVMFLDVGQGDSILIRSGHGKHVMIDTGGAVSFNKKGDEWRVRSDPYEVGRKLLVPLLLQRGVRQLDALVLTHLDADHIGGAAAVIENIPVRALLFNGTLRDSPGAIALFELAVRTKIPLYAVHDATSWEVDDSLKLEALYPAAERHLMNGVPIENEQNANSVVLLATLYGRTFLLPGDLEAEGELSIVANRRAFAAVDEPVDVLKAGHHGSRTSTTQSWLDYWRPTETVISVGRNNLYGHPHPTVVERLEESGTNIVRTDRKGEAQYRVYPDGTMERRTKRLL